MNIVRYVKNKISVISKMKRLFKVLSLIEVNECNGNIVMMIPNDIAIQSGGNILLYSKDGVLITKHKRTHINPEIEIDISNINDTAIKAKDRRDLNIKIGIFNRALKHKRVIKR
jgi:hypothetical protein